MASPHPDGWAWYPHEDDHARHAHFILSDSAGILILFYYLAGCEKWIDQGRARDDGLARRASNKSGSKPDSARFLAASDNVLRILHIFFIADPFGE
jgi:hypothetical protein